MESEQSSKTLFKKKRYRAIESRFYETDTPTSPKRPFHYAPKQSCREWESQHDVNLIDDDQQ